MTGSLLALGAVVAAPTTEEDVAISPGLIGFLATFAVVLVTVLLILDLTRRLRRLKYRELREEQRVADEAEAAAAARDPHGADDVRPVTGAPERPEDDVPRA